MLTVISVSKIWNGDAIGQTVWCKTNMNSPYSIYGKDKFKTLEDVKAYMRTLEEYDKVYKKDRFRKVFYDPTDIDGYPWIVYSWNKNDEES